MYTDAPRVVSFRPGPRPSQRRASENKRPRVRQIVHNVLTVFTVSLEDRLFNFRVWPDSDSPRYRKPPRAEFTTHQPPLVTSWTKISAVQLLDLQDSEQVSLLLLERGPPPKGGRVRAARLARKRCAASNVGGEGRPRAVDAAATTVARRY
jgi:hypothetical protein